jgi:hypothetical protein
VARRSRAGRTGGSWYGSYEIVCPGYWRSSETSYGRAEARARELSRSYDYAEVRSDPWTGSRLLAAFRNGRRIKVEG